MQPPEPPSHFAVVWYNLSRSLGGGGPLRLGSRISIFISFKSRSEEVAGGEQGTFQALRWLCPLPLFEEQIPNQAYPVYPRGEPSLLHSALLLPSILRSLSRDVLLSFTGTKPSPLQGSLGDGRGLLLGERVSSRALVPSPPPAAPIPGQQLPSTGSTEHRTDQAYVECIVNTIHLKVISPLPL